MKYLSILFTAVLLFSCNSPTKSENVKLITNNDFEQEINITKAEKILSDEFLIGIQVVDSVLLTKRKRNYKNNYLALYDLDNLQKIFSEYITWGDGPDEFDMPYISTSFYSKYRTDINVSVVDLPRYRVSLLNLTKTIETGKPVFEKRVKTHPKYGFRGMTVVNDSILYTDYGIYAYHRYRISKYNYVTAKIVTSAPLVPKLKNSELLNPPSINAFYSDCFVIKPDKTKLASALFYFNRIDFYDPELNLIQSIIGEDYKTYDVKELLNKEGWFEKKKRFYSELRVTDNYVYALFYKGDEKKPVPVNNPNPDSEEMNKTVDIRVFDWDGNPRFLVHLPNNIGNFDVDEKNGWIYGIDYENETNYRYKINFLNQ